MKLIRIISICTLSLFSFVSLSSAKASLVALSVTAGQTAPDPADAGFVNGTDGWSFTPGVDITVYRLGHFDDGQDGLEQDSPVGIYQVSNKTLITSVDVEKDGQLIGEFRYTDIPPVVLNSDVEYVVATFQEETYDPLLNNPTGVAFGPSITFGKYREKAGSELEFPTKTPASDDGSIKWVGPNFTYSIPEPSAFLYLIGISLMVTGYRRIGRKLRQTFESE